MTPHEYPISHWEVNVGGGDRWQKGSGKRETDQHCWEAWMTEERKRDAADDVRRDDKGRRGGRVHSETVERLHT